jgi:hypothetical protein
MGRILSRKLLFLAFGISGLGSQVLARNLKAEKLPIFSQILQILFEIDVFQTFDIITGVFILDKQNMDQKV